MLKASEERCGDLAVRFLIPTQVREEGRFTSAPSFRGVMNRLLFRANAPAEFYGSGMLYDNEATLRILAWCRAMGIGRASTEEIREERYFRRQRREKHRLGSFFAG